MSDPSVMRDAIKALRAESGHTHDAEATRRRIVGTVVQRKRQRRQAIALAAFVLIGLPLGGTAYAAFFGTPAVIQELLHRLELAQDEHVVRSGKRGHDASKVTAPTIDTPVAAAPVTQAVLAEPAPPPVASTSAAEPAPTLSAQELQATSEPTQRSRVARNARARQRTARVVAPQAPAASQAPDPLDALYTRAHELHFVTRDPAAALRAWDAYLQEAHSGALQLEAKYNRALCLVRLRRSVEAIEALTPFAHGDHGNYRKREAAALLQALGR